MFYAVNVDKYLVLIIVMAFIFPDVRSKDPLQLYDKARPGHQSFHALANVKKKIFFACNTMADSTKVGVVVVKIQILRIFAPLEKKPQLSRVFQH